MSFRAAPYLKSFTKNQRSYRKPILTVSTRHRRRLINQVKIQHNPENSAGYSGQGNGTSVSSQLDVSYLEISDSANHSSSIVIHESTSTCKDDDATTNSDSDSSTSCDDNFSTNGDNDSSSGVIHENTSPLPRSESDHSLIANSAEADDVGAGYVSHKHITADMLAAWAVRRNIHHEAFKDLLNLLREHECFNDLPRDPRTILKTPRCTKLRDMPPGKFFYLGIAKSICDFIKSNSVNITNDSGNIIKLLINVDGLPISKSTGSCLWPILGSIQGVTGVFLIACYHGLQKPGSSGDFLKEFVEEYLTLCRTGIEIESRTIEVKLHGFICDTPAKAFILCTKGHAGYFYCVKCEEEGEYLNHRMCFHELNAVLRTDESFKQKRNSEHHIEGTECALNALPDFGPVSDVPIDYMHLVLLGVIKRLIKLWVYGENDSRGHKLGSHKVKKLSRRLNKLKNKLCREFSRKSRSIETCRQWKATEFRLFLLYLGPVILKGILSDEEFENFMDLHVAISILCSARYYSVYCDYAENLLRTFVEDFKRLYGKHLVSFNVHALIHLANDCRKYGCLDNFSSFKFESYMQVLTKSQRKKAHPLQQLHRRYVERMSVNSSVVRDEQEIQLKDLHDLGHLPSNCKGPQYNNIKLPKFTLSNRCGDHCCEIEGGVIVVVENIAHYISTGEPVIIGRKFLAQTSLYPEPCDSRLYGVFKGTKLSNVEVFKISEIVRKYVNIPLKDGFALLPFLHL